MSVCNPETLKEEKSVMLDEHFAELEGAREESTLILRNFYKSEEIFLDMFEDEWREMNKRPINVEYVMSDASLLLPPTGIIHFLFKFTSLFLLCV